MVVQKGYLHQQQQQQENGKIKVDPSVKKQHKKNNRKLKNLK